MPKSELQYQEIREQSKKKILDAAFASFIRYGYTGASIAIIAKKKQIFLKDLFIIILNLKKVF